MAALAVSGPVHGRHRAARWPARLLRDLRVAAGDRFGELVHRHRVQARGVVVGDRAEVVEHHPVFGAARAVEADHLRRRRRRASGSVVR